MLVRGVPLFILLPLTGCFTPETPAGDTDSATAESGSTSADAGPGPGSTDATAGPTGSDSDPPGDEGTQPPPDDTTGGPGNDGSEGDSSEGDGGGGTTESGSDSSSGGPTCDAGSTCVEDVPAGWSGPVLLYDDVGDPPLCPGAAPQVAFDLGAGLSAEPATCTCECDDPTGLDCGAATLTERGDNCFSVLFDPATWQLNDGVCVPIFAASDAFQLSEPALQGAGSCAEIVDEEIEPAIFDRNVRACEAVAPGGDCEGTCAPETDGELDQICIYFEGDVACPDGEYSARTVAHGGFSDDRACSECTCGDPTGTCDGTAFLTDFDCGAGSVFLGSVDVGACGVASGPPSHAQYVAEVDAECSASGGDPEGEATATDPVTFCCLQ